MKITSSLNEKEFQHKLAEARIRVGQMDEIDGSKDRRLATILAALKAGLMNPSSDAAFDAYAMLEAQEPS